MTCVRARIALYTLAAITTIAPAAIADDWQNDYATALEAARAAHKPLLVVMELPSDRLAATRGDSQLGSSALLKPYQLCCIDVSTSEGQKVAEAFGAERFPYTVITDKDSRNIIHRKAGHYSKLDWSSLLMTYRNGQKPPAVVNELVRQTQSTPSVCFT
ncbi:MAG: hypothetical protein GTO03_14880 [Planctomycetales bacterium]|nr:hypothetical protein [Planctomycetales bacterium]